MNLQDLISEFSFLHFKSTLGALVVSAGPAPRTVGMARAIRSLLFFGGMSGTAASWCLAVHSFVGLPPRPGSSSLVPGDVSRIPVSKKFVGTRSSQLFAHQQRRRGDQINHEKHYSHHQEGDDQKWQQPWEEHLSFPRRRLSPLDQAGGILYRTQVFNRQELATMTEEIHRLYLTPSSRPGSISPSAGWQPEVATSVAQQRWGLALPANSATVAILQRGSLAQWIQTVVPSSPAGEKEEYILSTDLPVELRSYHLPGAGMAWHVDDVWYGPQPQIEVVWTLENTSNCQTLWKKSTTTTTTAASGEEEEEMIQSVETEPNSALILQAGGPWHCVTTLQRGRRIILKCVYHAKSSILLSPTEGRRRPLSHHHPGNKRPASKPAFQQFGVVSSSSSSSPRSKGKRSRK